MRLEGLGARRSVAVIGTCLTVGVIIAWPAATTAEAGCGLLGLFRCPPPPPPPPAPDPGGAETDEIPVPAPGKFFGFVPNHGAAPNPQIPDEQYAELAEAAGANSARLDLDWRYLERQQDVWDEGTWTVYERAYDAITRHSQTPVLNIGMAPTWARDPAFRYCYNHGSCRYPPARFMHGEWAEFAAEVARRFPEAVIEVWNEPNIPQFWRSGPNPARFAEVLAVAYSAIKGVSPSTTVLAGGVNNNQSVYGGVAGAGRAIPLRNFLDGAYAATPSIKGSMDALSFHISSQELNYSGGSLLAKVFDDVRSVRHKYGDDSRRLWITEAGLSTTGDPPRTEREQADGLLRQYRRLMTMPDVDAMLINSLVELPSASATSVNRGYGVRLFEQPDFPPKLAYCAFATRANSTPPAGCPPLWEPNIPSSGG